MGLANSNEFSKTRDCCVCSGIAGSLSVRQLVVVQEFLRWGEVVVKGIVWVHTPTSFVPPNLVLGLLHVGQPCFWFVG